MTEFHVPDMTCDGCVRAVTNAVQQIDPAATVTADLATHQVRIASAAAAQSLAAAVRGAGFTVQSVS